MNGRERILQALRRHPPDRIPTFEWFIGAPVGQSIAGSSDPIDIAERLDLEDDRALLPIASTVGPRSPATNDL